jgi:hypothetical protein
MDTEFAEPEPPAVTAPPAIEDKLAEIDEVLIDVVEKFNLAFGPA